jgi:hypothetical protein
MPNIGPNPGALTLQQIAAQACDNPAFRQQLVADPNHVLAQQGLIIPPNVNVVIHQNTHTELHLVLPCDQDLPPGIGNQQSVVHGFSVTHMF